MARPQLAEEATPVLDRRAKGISEKDRPTMPNKKTKLATPAPTNAATATRNVGGRALPVWCDPVMADSDLDDKEVDAAYDALWNEEE